MSLVYYDEEGLRYERDPDGEVRYIDVPDVPAKVGPPERQAGDGWPVLSEDALQGLAGRVVGTIRPHTEADDAALLLDFLASFGSAVGAGPHAMADGSSHPARLNVVNVGETARARKGTSRAQVRRVMAVADPGWSESRVMGGLASGEGVIAAVRDGDDEHEGVTDKRLFVFEPEFARVLGVAAREGNTLSAIVRDAWDSGRLRVMTRKDPLVATGAHISVLGHVTVDELKRRLAESEMANGFANRFLFALVRRSKLLPGGGNLDDAEIQFIGQQVRQALERARSIGTLRRTPAAEEHWTELYGRMDDDDPGGMVGAVTARAEAQTLRLSVTYALLDGERLIDVQHLKAAWAIWRFCRESAAFIFGESLGDEVADRLLEAIRRAGAAGLDFSQQHQVFGRHVPAKRLALARQTLEGRGLIVADEEQTDGRTRKLSRIANEAKEAK